MFLSVTNSQSKGPSYADSVNEFNQELVMVKNQCSELEKINAQFVTEKADSNNKFIDHSIISSTLHSDSIEEEIPMETTQKVLFRLFFSTLFILL